MEYYTIEKEFFSFDKNNAEAVFSLPKKRGLWEADLFYKRRRIIQGMSQYGEEFWILSNRLL